jgi:hypothetical protein
VEPGTGATAACMAQPDELTAGADGALYDTTESGGGVLVKLTLPH